MARRPGAPSRMETLVLSTLARTPMHGYELKMELRYKHVAWWAKCDHGHLYAALTRLRRQGCVREQAGGSGDSRRRILAITPKGRKRLLGMLEGYGKGSDRTYFDIDLFISASFVLPQKRVVALLKERGKALREELQEARELRDSMTRVVPPAGRLIMDHRIAHLETEIEFCRRAASRLGALSHWGPFLGTEPILDFLGRTGAQVEGTR